MNKGYVNGKGLSAFLKQEYLADLHFDITWAPKL